MFGQSSAPMTSAEGVLVTIDDESDTLHGPYPGTPAGGVGWEAGASALDDLALAHHPGQTVQSSKGVLQLELHSMVLRTSAQISSAPKLWFSEHVARDDRPCFDARLSIKVSGRLSFDVLQIWPTDEDRWLIHGKQSSSPGACDGVSTTGGISATMIVC